MKKQIALVIVAISMLYAISCKKAETSTPASSPTQISPTVTPTLITLESFTTPGTFQFTVPANVTSITAEVWAGGGGGAGSGGSGGGGGGYGQLQISVTPGSTYTIIVGNGGTPGSGGGSSSGATGGTSSFGTNIQTLVSATGGGGGCYCGGYTGGGNGSSGNIPGASSDDIGDGGAGGNGANGGAAHGGTGGFPGGGGGGGAIGSGGGSGGGGQVVITTLNTTNIPDTTLTYFTVTSWMQNLPTVWESSNEASLTASNNYIVSMSTSGNEGTYTQQLPSTGTTGFSYRVGQGHIDIVYGGSSAPSGTLYFQVKGY